LGACTEVQFPQVCALQDILQLLTPASGFQQKSERFRSQIACFNTLASGFHTLILWSIIREKEKMELIRRKIK